MTVETFTTPQSRTDFFQECIVRMIEYWQEHEAVKWLQIAVLDREREAILKVISLALDFTPAWPLVRGLIVAFTRYMERRGHWEVWNTVLHRAIKVAQQQEDIEGEITLCVLVARLSQRRSELESVVTFYRRVIQLARKSGNRYEEARASCNLGYYYIDAGHWWRSEVLSYHALEIFEELKSEHGLAHTHNHLGLLFIRKCFWTTAEEHLKKACQSWKTLGDEHGLLRGNLNLGLLHIEAGESIKALDYLQQALRYADTTGEEGEKGTILLNLGLAYLENQDLHNAVNYSRQAEDTFRKHANTIGLAQVWHNIGIIQFQQENWNIGSHYCQESLAAYRQMGNWDGQIRVYIDLINYVYTMGGKTLAIQYLKQLDKLLEQHNWDGHDRLNSRLMQLRQALSSINDDA